MGTNFPWTAYPILRLTIAMATGIFLFDKYLSDYVSLSVVFLVFFISVIFAFVFGRIRAYQYRHVFGITIFFACFLFGGVLVISERSKIEYPWNGKEQLYLGVVEATPKVKGKTIRAKVRVTSMLTDSDSAMVKPKELVSVDRSVLLYFLPDSVNMRLMCGDTICFYTRISRPVSDEFFSGFDYGAYLLRQGISGTGVIYQGNCRSMHGRRELSFSQQALRLRDKVVSFYKDKGLDGDELAVASAITVGDKENLSHDLKAAYSAAGVSHVLALSGLHIGILVSVLMVVLSPLRRFKKGKVCSSVFLLVLLWAFAFISGLSASVVRAVTMYSLYLIAAFLTEERFSGFMSLILAAFLMLLYQPFYLFDISFQLSFSAVAGILLFHPYLSEIFAIKNKLLQYIWNILTLSVSAQLATLPFILYYFGSFPVYFLLANLLVAPLVVCILVTALAAVACSALPSLCDGLIFMLHYFLNFLNTSVESVFRLSGSQLTSLHITGLQLCLMYVLMGIAYSYAIRRSFRKLAALLSVICLLLFSHLYEELTPHPDCLFFRYSELYVKRDREITMLEAKHGIYQVDTLKIGVMKDNYWNDKLSDVRLPLDYVYVCRGFKGNLISLSRLFHIKNVVLDASLSTSYRDFLVRECDKLHIPYVKISSQGSHAILL